MVLKSKNPYTFMNLLLIKRELDYYYYKNLSCLTINQLKTQYLRKSKTFKKIYKLLKIKITGQLKLQKLPPQVSTEWSIFA